MGNPLVHQLRRHKSTELQTQIQVLKQRVGKLSLEAASSLPPILYKSVYWHKAMLIIYILSAAAFTLQLQLSRCNRTENIYYWPFIEKPFQAFT